VLQLGQQKEYDDHIQNAVLWQQLCNADGKFIWVALSREIHVDVEEWNILDVLK